MNAVRFCAGMTVDRYELLRPIGHGAMGSVYEALDRSLVRRVALKVLHAPSTDGVHARRAEERFLREGRAAAQVRHAHVVDVYDFGVDGGVPFLVMELVEGESLAQLLRRETRLPVERAVEILVPILSAVAELHAAGIVHRDIKPANILLARGGDCPKLADFGVSQFDDGSPSITQSGATIGTPEYMAPELLRARMRGTEQSDQYALGVTLYECMTGERPFRGDTDYEIMDAVVRAVIPPPSARERSLPVAIDGVLLRAMHRDPGERFASVDELAEALLPFAPESVAMRWRAEFLPSGAHLEWEANAPARRSVPTRTDTEGRGRGRTVGRGWTALGVVTLATIGLGTWVAGARSTATGPTPAPASAPTAPLSSANTAMDAPPIVAHAQAPWSTTRSPGPAPDRQPAVSTPGGKPLAHARARPAADVDAGSISYGENGAPILDVP